MAHSCNRARVAAFNAALGMFKPKWPAPISEAENNTSGARSKPPLSSIIRIPFSGADTARQPANTPKFSSNVRDGKNSAAVRLSAAVPGCGVINTVSCPWLTSPSALSSPTGPPPTTMIRYFEGFSANIPTCISGRTRHVDKGTLIPDKKLWHPSKSCESSAIFVFSTGLRIKVVAIVQLGNARFRHMVVSGLRAPGCCLGVGAGRARMN